MKHTLIFFILLLGLKSYSQDTTIVTSLQLKAKTVRGLETISRVYTEVNFFEAYLKWYNHFKANNPNDNANVTIDSIPVLMLADIYGRILFDVRYGDIVDDVQQSTVSKRSANDYLDRLMTTHEVALQKMKDDLILDNRFKKL